MNRIRHGYQHFDRFCENLSNGMQSREVSKMVAFASIVGLLAFTTLNAAGVGVPLRNWGFDVLNGTALSLTALITLGTAKNLYPGRSSVQNQEISCPDGVVFTGGLLFLLTPSGRGETPLGTTLESKYTKQGKRVRYDIANFAYLVTKEEELTESEAWYVAQVKKMIDEDFDPGTAENLITTTGRE